MSALPLIRLALARWSALVNADPSEPAGEPREDGQDWLAAVVIENAREYAIFSTDLQRRVTSWNTGAQRLLGLGALGIGKRGRGIAPGGRTADAGGGLFAFAPGPARHSVTRRLAVGLGG